MRKPFQQALKLVSFVQGYDTSTHVMVGASFKTGMLHHLLKRFLIGMHANGFSKVTVAFFIVGNGLAHLRQYIKGRKILCPVQPWHDRFGKLQHQQPAAGFEHPIH